jgi:hypothetical protein
MLHPTQRKHIHVSTPSDSPGLGLVQTCGDWTERAVLILEPSLLLMNLVVSPPVWRDKLSSVGLGAGM